MLSLELNEFDEFDIMQNASIGAMCIHSFTRAYQNSKQKGVILPLAFVVLPVVLSKTLADQISNRKTSLGSLTKVLNEDRTSFVGIQDRMKSTYGLTWASIRLAIKAEMVILDVNNDCELKSVREGNVTNYHKLSAEVQSMIRASSRLGSWFGKQGLNEILSTFNLQF